MIFDINNLRFARLKNPWQKSWFMRVRRDAGLPLLECVVR